MPWKPRFNLPGMPPHVIGCGNQREPRRFSEAVRDTRVDAPGQPEELALKHEAYRAPG